MGKLTPKIDSKLRHTLVTEDPHRRRMAFGYKIKSKNH